MANQYILIVSKNEKGFMANSLNTAFQNYGIETKCVAVTDISLCDYIEASFGALIVDCCENVRELQAIKNKCYATKKQLILYGSPAELDSMRRIFIDSIVFKELERPVELEEVALQTQKLRAKERRKGIMKKILVVDDNGTILRTIKGWLDGKYEVTLANSAANAATAIEKERPDLILLDYEMPVCSGAQFMAQLASAPETRDIAVIFLTSRCDAATVNEVMSFRPKGYVLKTTSQELLLQKIEDYFEQDA